ncbi:unnamed protein product [Linum tenue]|uniref:3-ketoacyl-CoA synthase n=1 Tax=Linum tenue TaxID=586396 RepID=A0AAV0MSK2_9ROSI|nr:unnamed protein product [Linum tenue]
METIFVAALVSLLYAILNICRYLHRKSHQRSCCYMLAYQCHVAPDDLKLSTGTCSKIVLRTIISSGVGEETYCPANILQGRETTPSLHDSLQETDDVVFSTLDNLFATSGISPSQIDILVTTVSLFAPSPSISSRIANRYKMKEGVQSFSLAGMGCSASLVGIDLVRRMFTVHPNAFALVVSTENIGAHWYQGKDRSFMLSNVLFRTGGASVLLTNDPSWKDRAILNLVASARTHLSSDEAYGAALQVEDDQGYRGFRLSKDLPRAAVQALVRNFRVLLPRVLPAWEIARYVVVYSYTFCKRRRRRTPLINMKSGIQHFCVHPGGRAVIDGVGRSLGLGEEDLEPSRMTLHRFGNTSSGGLWYVLGYMEAKKRLRRGERVLMISLGAGFMCNSCVWEVLRDVGDVNVWGDCIQRYPPLTLVNPFADKFDWIHEDYMNFIRLEDYDRAQFDM